jgi:ribosomal protein L11 methyltransferase
LKAQKGDFDIVSETYDLIFANINRNTLIRNIAHSAERLKSQGILLISGFYQNDLMEITQMCKSNGLTFQSNNNLDDWVCAKYVYSGL